MLTPHLDESPPLQAPRTYVVVPCHLDYGMHACVPSHQRKPTPLNTLEHLSPDRHLHKPPRVRDYMCIGKHDLGMMDSPSRSVQCCLNQDSLFMQLKSHVVRTLDRIIESRCMMNELFSCIIIKYLPLDLPDDDQLSSYCVTPPACPSRSASNSTPATNSSLTNSSPDTNTHSKLAITKCVMLVPMSSQLPSSLTM